MQSGDSELRTFHFWTVLGRSESRYEQAFKKNIGQLIVTKSMETFRFETYNNVGVQEDDFNRYKNVHIFTFLFTFYTLQS